MIYATIVIAVIILLWIAHEMFKHLRLLTTLHNQHIAVLNETHAKERQMLLDRIQAKDFTEYKVMSNPVKRTEQKPPQEPIIPL